MVNALGGIEVLEQLLSRHSGKKLIAELGKEDVEFVIIGGTALAFHGVRDINDPDNGADDLDVLIPANKANADGIKKALLLLMPSYSNCLSDLDLEKPGTKIRLTGPTVEFYAELLIAGESENAQDIYRRSEVVKIGDTLVHVTTIEQLEPMKEKVVREFRERFPENETDLEFREKLSKHERDLAAIRGILKS